jgi:predicted dehydrogenase
MSPTNVNHSEFEGTISRRGFLKKSSAALAGAATLASAPFVITSHAAPDDPIRIGVIGCGGRGTGAVLDAIGAATKVIYPSDGYHTEDAAAGAQVLRKGIQVMALADLFPDRLEACRGNLKKVGVNIPNELCFSGFDAYKQLLGVGDINYVIVAGPPHFHPIHLKAAVEAGKNVFMEKPAAVDGPGIKLVLEAHEIAKQKNLGIAAGTQRRHQLGYQETVQRIRDGAIGNIVYGRCYWNGGEIWVIEREAGWTDMEWQLRNWNYFTWLGGDHIVEQHVHNLDIMNWVIGTHPVKATALGGRQARVGQRHGHIYDHFAVEFEYPNGVRMFSQCRQINGCENKVEEAVMGTKGESNCASWIKAEGQPMWRFRGKEANPYHQEHIDLMESIRSGKPINEAKNVAESTMLGIMGRESAYAGRSVTWDEILTGPRLGPEKYDFGPVPFPEVAIPGKYKM